MTLTTLAEALRGIGLANWRHALYCRGKSVTWTLETLCMVLDPNDADEDQDPLVAIENEIRYALDVSCAQDVVTNLESRMEGEPSDQDLLLALQYFMAHHAFLPDAQLPR